MLLEMGVYPKRELLHLTIDRLIYSMATSSAIDPRAPASFGSDLEHRVVAVDSRRSVKLALSELIVDSSIELFSEIESRKYFTLQFDGKSLQLTAGPYIGLIPINSRITIDVRPKLPVSNLARVIELSQYSLQILDTATRLYDPADQQSTSVLEFLAKSLLRNFNDIRIHGLHRTYTIVTRDAYPRGRLNVQQTMRKYLARGVRHKVVSAKYELTTNTEYNRLLKFALWFAAERLVRIMPRDRLLLQRINDALHELDGVSLSNPEAFLRSVERDLRDDRISKSRYYYRKPLSAAVAIVKGGVELPKLGNEVELSSYIINFESLFETYLRNVLTGRFLQRGSEIRVLDGNSEGRRRLFDDQKEPRAQPDIVIVDREQKVLAVLDVKYKEKPDRADVNQAIAYAAVYRTSTVVLVHQAASSGLGGLQRVGSIANLRIYFYAFDLGKDDLEEEEVQFANQLYQLCS